MARQNASPGKQFAPGMLDARRKQAVTDTPEPADERERLLIEAVVTLARTLRDERDRLADRLREVETELNSLTARLDGKQSETASSPGSVE
jgi:hypothetical protein